MIFFKKRPFWFYKVCENFDGTLWHVSNCTYGCDFDVKGDALTYAKCRNKEEGKRQKQLKWKQIA